MPGPRDDICVILGDDPPCSIGTSTRERVDADGERSARAIRVFGVAGVPARDSGRGMAGSGGTAGSRGAECGKRTGLSGLAITKDPETLFVDDLLRGCPGVRLRLTLGGGSSSKSA